MENKDLILLVDDDISNLKRAQNIWKNRVARNTFFLATTFLIRHMPERH